MADGAFNEKLSIRDSAKSLKKYGSTSSHIKRNETYIKHIICPTDTLQGIALKYGVTTEQIRRANRMWASDSLFLREHLLIPTSLDSPFTPSTEEPKGVPISETPSASSQSLTIAGSLENDNIDDFLKKIDSCIETTKKEVKKFEGNSEFTSDLFHGYERRKPAVSRMRQSANNNSSPDLHSTPHAVVTTHGRKLRTSLQRLEQQQDEIFEL